MDALIVIVLFGMVIYLLPQILVGIMLIIATISGLLALVAISFAKVWDKIFGK